MNAADLIAASRWQLSSSSDRRALDVVDGREEVTSVRAERR
jgi:hypothetical protein